jgi:cellulose 1,4-beta-cellobiosidase
MAIAIAITIAIDIAIDIAPPPPRCQVWLDSNDPTTDPASKPGVARGTCSIDSGKPADVESQHGDASVTYSNIRSGDIGSTYAPGPSPGPAPPGPSPGPTPPGPSPSGCPGGSLSACIALCPANPPKVYKACVQDCANRCP